MSTRLLVQATAPVLAIRRPQLRPDTADLLKIGLGPSHWYSVCYWLASGGLLAGFGIARGIRRSIVQFGVPTRGAGRPLTLPSPPQGRG
jgi:hypothetical protein